MSSPVPMSTLRLATSTRRAPVGERCEMCAEPIRDQHQHVVNLESRALLCTCRGCYLPFSGDAAHHSYGAVPERHLSFSGFRLGPAQWSALEIPVGLAFFFRSSTSGRTVAFCPGPAGAAESVIIRVPGTGAAEAHLVPIDACYEPVGPLRQVWRGFDGGQEARARIDTWFQSVRARSRPAGGPR